MPIRHIFEELKVLVDTRHSIILSMELNWQKLTGSDSLKAVIASIESQIIILTKLMK